MRKETDLAKVKRTAHMFLALDIQLTAHSPIVVSHPFTCNGIVAFRDEHGEISVGNLIEKPDDLARWRRQVGAQIDQANSIPGIFFLLNKPYYLAFLKYTASALPRHGGVLPEHWRGGLYGAGPHPPAGHPVLHRGQVPAVL